MIIITTTVLYMQGLQKREFAMSYVFQDGKLDGKGVLYWHGRYINRRNRVVKLEKELSDYKKHFEPQMIQIQLLEKAQAEQALTFRRG